MRSKELASESKVTEMISLSPKLVGGICVSHFGGGGLFCVHCPVISRGVLHGSHKRQQLYPCAAVTVFFKFIMENSCVYCAVRAEYLNIT